MRRLASTRHHWPGPDPCAALRPTAPGDDWEIQTDFFSRQGGEFTCCTIDNRGTGHSSTPRGLLTTHDMALDAASVLTHLEWTKDVHVVAISMVGWPAGVPASPVPHACFPPPALAAPRAA